MAEVAFELLPMIRVYKDGRVERLLGNDIVPPSLDPKTGVESKDIVISPETGVSARLYIPKTTDPLQKLPLLVYFHGGGFCLDTAFSPTYHNYLNSLVSEANIIAVSVDYRRAPEHPVPIAFEDSWAALKWIASHSDQKGPESWLNNHTDFQKVFLAGDSAGATIVHNMAIKAGTEELEGIKLVGIALVHSYFCGKEAIGAEIEMIEKKANADKLWLFVCPSTTGCDDPLINPGADPKLSTLGCSRVLVCVAGRDLLRDRGWYYYEMLGKSGWGGDRVIMEAEGENHEFHLYRPTCENAVAMLKRVASFINEPDK